MKIGKSILIAFVLLLSACPTQMTPKEEIITVSVKKLTDGHINQDYYYEIPYQGDMSTFYFQSDTLPPGLQMDSLGIISGTPTQDGVFNTDVNICRLSDDSIRSTQKIEIAIIEKKLTIMVHAAFDNNIDYEYEEKIGSITAFTESLKQLQNSWSTQNVQFTVLFDSQNNRTPIKDGYYALSGGDFEKDLKLEIPEVNSGSTKDVNSFIDWTYENYPADSYMYIIHSHGSGFVDTESVSTSDSTARAISSDETDEDFLTHAEIEYFLKHFIDRTGTKLDLFYPYACLMGGIELAWSIKDYSNYMLASEDSFPAEHWRIDDVIAHIGSKELNGKNIGTALCDSAFSFMPDESRKFDLSLINLNKIQGLYNEIEDFSVAALNDIREHNNLAPYNKAALYAYRMDVNQYMDLGHFMKLLSSSSGLNEAVKNEALNVITSLGSILEYQKKNAMDNCYGLSIYFPFNTQYLIDMPADTYKKNITFGSNSWVDFAELVSGGLNKDFEDDIYEPDNDKFTATPIKVNETQYHTLKFYMGADGYRKMDGDYYTIDLQEGDTVSIHVNPVFDASGLLNSPLIKYVDICTDKYPDKESLSGFNHPRNTLDSAIYFECPKSDTYFIQVYDEYEDEGPYTIEVKEWEPNYDIYEPDNDMSGASSVILVDGETQEHNFHSYFDEDWIAVDLVLGQRIQIKASSHEENAELYAYIGYYNSDTGYLYDTEYSDWRTANTLDMIYEAKQTGRHFMRMSDSSSKTDYAEYSLSIVTAP